MATSKKQSSKKDKDYDMEIEESKQEEVQENGLTPSQEQKLIDQVTKEYELAKESLDTRLKVNLRRLKLYNNQRRQEKKVGVPLLFTVFNSLLAALYDDRMSVRWEGREAGDEQVEEYLNLTSEYDYDKMEKAELDYDWLWDTLFFGFGLVNLTEFDRKSMLPIPELIDPSTFLYDPKAESVDGNVKGMGAMRFCGREVLLTKYQMESIPGFKCIDDVKQGKNIQDDLTAQAIEMRQDAMGTNDVPDSKEADLGENTEYKILEWRTWFDGKRRLIHLSNDISKVNRYKELKTQGWGIAEKIAWRVSHQFPGVSVPDLVEDKQRKQSEMINLGIGITKSDLYPMYGYDEERVTNRNDLAFGFNKFIPVRGNPSQIIAPINKVSPNLALYTNIMEFLDAAAQRATATPELQQGVTSKEARTLGELNLVAQKVDTRYSLVVKGLMRGEKKFWRLWYMQYKNSLDKDIDKKVIRLRGTTSNKFRELTKDQLVLEKVDPDVQVESKILSEARMMNELSKHGSIIQLAASDRTSNRRWGLKHLAKLAGMEMAQVDFLFPPTLDERLAREQNEALNNNKKVPVAPEDNHHVHLEIHGEANPTEATRVHIEAHKKMMVLQRQRPDLFPQLQQGTMEGQEGLQPGQEGAPSDVQSPNAGLEARLREAGQPQKPSDQAGQEALTNGAAAPI